MAVDFGRYGGVHAFEIFMFLSMILLTYDFTTFLSMSFSVAWLRQKPEDVFAN